MTTIVDGFSKRHKQQVAEQGARLHESGVTHVAMRGGANQQLSAEQTPGMKEHRTQVSTARG